MAFFPVAPEQHAYSRKQIAACCGLFTKLHLQLQEQEWLLLPLDCQTLCEHVLSIDHCLPVPEQFLLSGDGQVSLATPRRHWNRGDSFSGVCGFFFRHRNRGLHLNHLVYGVFDSDDLRQTTILLRVYRLAVPFLCLLFLNLDCLRGFFCKRVNNRISLSTTGF